MRAPLVLLVAVCATACFSEADDAPADGSGPGTTTADDTTGTSGLPATNDDGADGSDDAPATGSDGSDDTGPLPPCPGEDRCMLVPPGFTGPVAIVQGPAETPLPNCFGDYEQPVWELSGDLDEGDANCACSCGAASNVGCGPFVLEHFDPTDDTCTAGAIDTYDLVDGCTTFADVLEPGFYGIAPTTLVGDCPAVADPQLDTPRFETDTRACAPAPLPSCGPGVCAPAPPGGFEGGLCVWTAGDVACPPMGPFTDKRLRLGGFEDARGCDDTDCACEVGGAVCDALADIGPTCMEASETVSPGSCTPLTGSMPSEAVLITDITGAPVCTAAQATVPAVGEVIGQGPVTFCCEA